MDLCFGLITGEGIGVKRIFIVGSLNMDLVVRSPHMPKAGETVTGNGFMENGGGKGANQAVASARLGGKVFLCGVTGEDNYGKKLTENLEKAGVDVSFVHRAGSISTGIAIIIVSEGDNRIILDRGANAFLGKQDIDLFLEHAKEGDIYLTQLENPIPVVGYGLKRAKEKGLLTILNPAPADPGIVEYFPYVDIIAPNEGELEAFGGKEILLKAGLSRIITTLGEDGYEIAERSNTVKYSCMKVKAIDTTAAGDTFCGGVAVGLSENKTLAESALFGSTAASIACTRYGAQQSVPSREEVLTALLSRS